MPNITDVMATKLDVLRNNSPSAPGPLATLTLLTHDEDSYYVPIDNGKEGSIPRGWNIRPAGTFNPITLEVAAIDPDTTFDHYDDVRAINVGGESPYGGLYEVTSKQQPLSAQKAVWTYGLNKLTEKYPPE